MTFARVLAVNSLLAVIFLFIYGDWGWIVTSLLYYKIVVGFLGNQISQHRYFSHNSFKTTKIKKYFLYFVSLTTGVNPLDYALVHRHHHLHSDSPGDVHSKLNRFSDIFFPISGKTSSMERIKIGRVLDSDLRGFYKYHIATILFVLVLTALLSWKVAVFVLLAGVGWNYIHMILLRVWLVHTKLPGSYQNFDSKDSSWNNKWVQLLDIGEGLHNNHHYNPNAYNQAMVPGEFDPAGYIVRKFFIV